jgi:hypothetical protein
MSTCSELVNNSLLLEVVREYLLDKHVCHENSNKGPLDVVGREILCQHGDRCAAYKEGNYVRVRK